MSGYVCPGFKKSAPYAYPLNVGSYSGGAIAGSIVGAAVANVLLLAAIDFRVASSNESINARWSAALPLFIKFIKSLDVWPTAFAIWSIAPVASDINFLRSPNKLLSELFSAAFLPASSKSFIWPSMVKSLSSGTVLDNTSDAVIDTSPTAPYLGASNISKP